MEDLNCGNLDWDDFFAYRTPKIVIMRDRYLGFLHYAFMGGIFGYIVIYVIILEKGYLEEDIPITASRLTLREPSASGLSGDLNQCNYAAVRNDISNLTYCSQSPGSPSRIPCEYADWQAVVYPADMPNAIFVTTSNTVTTQKYNCDPKTNNCYYPFATLSKEEHYIANIENFTIGTFHSVRANKFYDEKVSSGDWDYNGNPYKQSDTAASNGVMKGEMLDLNGKKLCTFGNQNVDVLPFKKILEAAKVDSLDDMSTVDPTKTIRSEGLVITLSIEYHNRESKNYTISYTYRAAILPQISYKVEEPVVLYDANNLPKNRIIYNRHGIKFIILPTGTIYRFNFQVLLVQLVSGLALLALASTMVDLLALKVMPMRKHYQNYKMEVTEDFSSVRGQIHKEESLSQVKQPNPGMNKYVAMTME